MFSIFDTVNYNLLHNVQAILAGPFLGPLRNKCVKFSGHTSLPNCCENDLKTTSLSLLFFVKILFFVCFFNSTCISCGILLLKSPILLLTLSLAPKLKMIVSAHSCSITKRKYGETDQALHWHFNNFIKLAPSKAANSNENNKSKRQRLILVAKLVYIILSCLQNFCPRITAESDIQSLSFPHKISE